MADILLLILVALKIAQEEGRLDMIFSSNWLIFPKKN